MKVGIAMDNNSGDLKTDGLVPSLFKGWMKIPFEQSIKNAPGIKSKLKQSEIKTVGKMPVVDQGESFIAGYTDDENNLYKAELPLIVFGDHTRRIKYVDFPFAVGADGTKIIIPENYFLTRFFYQYLNALNWQHEGYGRNYKFLKQIIVPLPPLNEQKRIVTKLDAIMPRIEAVKARLDKVPGILKRFRQSVLTAAVTGKLTEQWRLEHPEVGEWEEYLLSEIIEEGPQNGLYKSQDFYGNGVLILRIDNFYDGSINPWETLKRLDVTESEKATYLLKKGDIVINRVNSMSFLGKSALVRNLPESCVFESNMMRIRLNKNLANPEYIIRYLNCQHGLAELRKNAKHAVNQSSINQQDIKAVNCPLPPLSEQKEIVRQVDKLFALADKVEAHYQKAKAKVDKLSQSVLAKAFRGELVPQDPNDLPAAELLKQILAEKDKMAAQLKKRKTKNVKQRK